MKYCCKGGALSALKSEQARFDVAQLSNQRLHDKIRSLGIVLEKGIFCLQTCNRMKDVEILQS